MTDRKAINRRNRGFGKGVERNVADVLGGKRVPMSGAVKSTDWTLVGDVHVADVTGERTVAVIECKGSSAITPTGDKTFTLKKSVLDQAQREAAQLDADVAAVWIHWRGANYRQDDYVILPAATFAGMLEILKHGQRHHDWHPGEDAAALDDKLRRLYRSGVGDKAKALDELKRRLP